MPGVPFGPFVLPVPAVFALLAWIAVLPVPLLALWRADVLRRPANVERPAWFAWVTRVQWLMLVSGLVTPVVTLQLPIRAALFALGVRSPLVASALALVVGLAPFVAHLALAVAVSGDVERRLRGVSLGVRERLARFAATVGLFGPLIAGLVLSAVALTSGNGPLAVGLLTAGVLGFLVLASTRSALLGMQPEALTSGPLRDRIGRIAAQAGVAVHHVHVLGAEDVRMANAFALEGGRVMLTDHLLTRLSRREVDAIVAHELAHLKEAHPKKLKFALLVAGALCVPLLMLPIGPVAFVLPGLVGYAAYLFVSRRFEFVADRLAAEWTGDAPALVSGLVRLAHLSHYPVAWSRVREWTLTHPSTRRRAEALVAAGRLDRAQAESLLVTPADDPERWIGNAPRTGPVFGTPERTARSAAASWTILAACTLPPTALLAACAAFFPDSPRPLLIAVGAALAFAGAWVAADVASVGGFPRWRRSLAARLAPPDEALFVGLAPHAPDVVYENYADWDLGFLTLEPGVLRVRGERTEFALARDRVTNVQVVPGLPGWQRTSRVAITWTGDDGAPRAFVLRDADARALREFPARAERLAARVRAWRDAAGPPDVRSEGAPPDAATVTGTPFATLVAPATLLPVAPLLALLAVCFASLAGLPLAPWAGPGAFDVFACALAAMIAMRVPAWRAAGRSTPAPHPAALDRAA